MLIEIQWHPTPKQLRVFGVGGLLASFAAALVLHFVWAAAALWTILVLAAGTALCLCSLISPAVTRILYLGLTLVAMPIGFVVSIVLLAVFYFLLLTPVAFIFRVIGRDVLCRRFDAAAESYWVPHKPSEDTERYFHQF
ncbi:MAG: hypothetical protein M1376_09375 [Planctomycetes bacterium]|nr:hypothetical protein [Planctomycetota bacterium]